MELGDRRQRILAAVVNDYVQTAEPVGSEGLVQRYDFGVKPATIRNELAVMSDLGYLRQPHTSAGRVPSDRGYRYYVDQLMPDTGLEPSETRRARKGYDSHEDEIEDILQQTCRILANLTRYASVATPPQMDTIAIRHVALSSIGEGKVLVITILSTGHIDHRVLDYSGKLTPADLIAIGNLISERFRETDLNGFTSRAGEELPSELQKFGSLYKKASAAMKQALVNAADDEVFVDGTSNIMRQPEFADRGRMNSILEALEHRRVLYQVLSSSLLGKNVTVIIGSENRLDEMHECSVVASGYTVGGKVCGSIGVVGPTRMDYRRSVAAVEFMASNLSGLLTSLSIW